jgi:hypothetical protein
VVKKIIKTKTSAEAAQLFINNAGRKFICTETTIAHQLQIHWSKSVLAYPSASWMTQSSVPSSILILINWINYISIPLSAPSDTRKSRKNKKDYSTQGLIR